MAEEPHFRRAAACLHVVQPALSQQIARLEQELGVSLVARGRRQITLTGARLAFLENTPDLPPRPEAARLERAAA